MVIRAFALTIMSQENIIASTNSTSIVSHIDGRAVPPSRILWIAGF